MTGGGEVKLIGMWTSSFDLRVRIALNLKGVQYEYLQETYGAKTELLLESNPVYKKIPVLIHDNKPLSESTIILQYVDEVFEGPRILPMDPYDRATARFWAYYVDDKWFPSLNDIVRSETEEARAEAAAQATAGLQLLEEAFEKCSKGKDFFGGDAIGYLDIVFGSYLGWLAAAEKMAGFELLDGAKMPHLAAWAARFRAEPAVQEVMPEADKLLEFATGFQAVKSSPPA